MVDRGGPSGRAARLDPLRRSPLAPAPRTLVDIIEASAAEHGGAPALDDGDTVLTYRTLLRQVRGMAQELERLGVRRGDRVGVRVSSGTSRLYIAILAALYAGAAYVPVDADDPPERAELVFGEADVAVVVEDSRIRVVRGDLTLVSALHSAEIDRDRLGHEGSRMLVDLLEIAEGHAGEGMDAWPVLAGEPDRLLVDLAERLYSRGLEVVANVGIPGGMRIPLAIGHPDSPGRLLLAVLTDDEEYLAEPSQRVRDRARPRWLEAQGWAVYTALSMALFIDPEKEASAIVDSVLNALEKLHATQDEPVVAIPERVVDDEAAEERVEEASAATASSGSDESEDGSEDDSEDGSEEPVAPRMPMLDDGLDEESKRRKKADEDTTGMLLAIKRKERASEENRGPRPAIAKGLPLAAYSDDQLDEMAAWVRSDGVERTDLETAEELREALGITRRGFQSDAVLGNVVRRTKPAAAQEAGEALTSEDVAAEESSDE